MSSQHSFSFSSDLIFAETVCAPVNIAVIKYWGKHNVEWNTPTNDSMSVTLDTQDLRAVTTVAASPSFAEHQLWLNGKEVDNICENKRFMACVKGVQEMARDRANVASSSNTVVPTVTADDWKHMKVHVSSYNTFPTAAGLASSAAGYAALVATLAALMNAPSPGPNDNNDDDDNENRLSVIARQGSGSSCRSLYGGFVAWRRGDFDESSHPAPFWDSKAEPVAPHTHWPDLRAIIVVASSHQKAVSSTSGMQTTVKTSPLLQYRADHVVPARMQAMQQAILQKDFTTFGKITMQDSNQFHATCLDTYPPIFYLNPVSQAVIHLVHAYNDYHSKKHGDNDSIRVAYTFDAGPNAVLYMLEKDMVEFGALLLHYFPPVDSSSSLLDSFLMTQTCRTPAQEMQSFVLEAALVDFCNKRKCPVLSTGDVQGMYVTRAGPGPSRITNESNLDPNTGLNSYVKPEQ